jgi:hypothetical protein
MLLLLKSVAILEMAFPRMNFGDGLPLRHNVAAKTGLRPRNANSALANLAILPGRNNCEGHEGFADEPPVLVDNVAIDDARISSLTQYASVGRDFPMLDGLEKIDLHFDGNDARSYRRGQKRGEPSCGIGQHGQNPAMNNSMNLLVQIQHWHAKHGMASLGLVQHKAEVVNGVAVAETFRSPR